MRLISNSHVVEIKGGRLQNVSDDEFGRVLRDAVMASCNGLIFVDFDDHECFDGLKPQYGCLIEQIRSKTHELTIGMGAALPSACAPPLGITVRVA